MDNPRIAIITPVYNDWESLFTMIKEIDNVLLNEKIDLSILVVNDGSTVEIDKDKASINNLNIINKVEFLHLRCNLGHQRAIAVGMAEMANRKQHDAVIVMDSDGEDSPSDLLTLIKEYRVNSDKIVVARRAKRSEGNFFQFGYGIYRSLFRLLTGKSIQFGNFCIIPSLISAQLVYYDSLWSHLAATITRSKISVVMIPISRGKRYTGKPKMNLVSLILHGLSAVAVYSDIVFLRTLFASLMLSVLTIVGISIVTIIHFYTELAIPSWASDVVGALIIIFIQCLVVSIFVLFIILANRSQRTFIPAKNYSDFVREIEVVYQR